MQTASSGMWTRVTDSISWVDNRYSKHASYKDRIMIIFTGVIKIPLENFSHGHTKEDKALVASILLHRGAI